MSIWNDDTVRTLTELTAAGYSSADIAHEFRVTHHIMGVTRNMIIGKRWRMNMPPGSRGTDKPKRAKPALPAKVKREAKVKHEKRVTKRLKRKLPGRLLFNLGFRGETM